MGKTLFETLFGPMTLSDGLFRYGKKSIETSENFSDADVTEDKYAFKFHVTEEEDINNMSVSVKDRTLKVSYRKDTDYGYTKYDFARLIPDDAILDTLKAEADGKLLTVTVEREKKVTENKPREIPILFESETSDTTGE